MYFLGCISGSSGRIFQKIQISYFPCMRYKLFKFGRDGSIVKGTFLTY